MSHSYITKLLVEARESSHERMRQSLGRRLPPMTIAYAKRAAPSDTIVIEFEWKSYAHEILTQYESVQDLQIGPVAMVTKMKRLVDNKLVVFKVFPKKKNALREAVILTAAQQDQRTAGLAPHLYDTFSLSKWDDFAISEWIEAYEDEQGSDPGVPSEFYVIVVEFVIGTPIQDIYQARGRRIEFLPVEEARRAVDSTLVLLRRLHDAGVAHRDLRTPNVVVANDGTLRLIDFGNACITETSFLAPRIQPSLRCDSMDVVDPLWVINSQRARQLQHAAFFTILHKNDIYSLATTVTALIANKEITSNTQPPVYPLDDDVDRRLRTMIGLDGADPRLPT